mmetsp:Transcript_30076/g.54867  ORF Transcript_30076/g.54867 Transcript_30076/m.54867 type:complete len:247 (+) Transcript_30076:799-1539(+)
MPRASGALSSAPVLAFEAAASFLPDACSNALHAFKAADFAADTASCFCDGSLPPAFANALIALPADATRFLSSSGSVSLDCPPVACLSSLSAFSTPETPPARTRLPCRPLFGFDGLAFAVSLAAFDSSSSMGWACSADGLAGDCSADGLAGDCQARAIMAGAAFAPGAAVRAFFLEDPLAPLTSPMAASGSERLVAAVPLEAGKASIDCCTQATCCSVGATSTTSSSRKTLEATSSCGTKKPPMIS